MENPEEIRTYIGVELDDDTRYRMYILCAVEKKIRDDGQYDVSKLISELINNKYDRLENS